MSILPAQWSSGRGTVLARRIRILSLGSAGWTTGAGVRLGACQQQFSSGARERYERGSGAEFRHTSPTAMSWLGRILRERAWRRGASDERAVRDEEDSKQFFLGGRHQEDAAPPLPLSRMFGLAKKERGLVALALGAQLVSSTAAMTFPLAMGKIVDVLGSDALVRGHELNAMAAGLFLLFSVAAVGVGIRSSVMTIVGERISRDLRSSLFRSVMSQDTAFFDVRHSGELANRLSSDTYMVSRTLSDNLARIVRSLTTSFASVMCLLWISPKLALVALALGPALALSSVYFGRIVRMRSQQMVDALASANDIASERISSVRTVRIFGAEQLEIDRYGERLDVAYRRARSIAVAEGLYSFSTFWIAQVSIIGVLLVGGKMVIQGSLSVGNLTSFAMYAVNLGFSLSNLANSYSNLTKGQGAGSRIFEILDRQPPSGGLQRGLHRPVLYQSPIEFRNVSFAYPTRPAFLVLRNFSLVISPGEVVGIAGSSGSGKSTVMHLLARLYKPSSGEILLGSTTLNQIDPLWLHHELGFVSQDPVLFSGSLAENILYGLDPMEFGPDSVQDVIHLTGLEDLVSRLPNGLDTEVGEKGFRLSGGERQRLALARALVRQPSILALDEATSALDPRNEANIGDAIDSILKNKPITVLLVSHRTSTLRRATRIVLLDKGSVAQEGSFDDLERESGLFADILASSAYRGLRAQ